MKSLIIDDDASSRNVFRVFLENYGECELASTGYEGVELFKKHFTGGGLYDLIIIDLILPDINGYEILKIIRTEEDINKIDAHFRTKVILTTSLDDNENRKIAEQLTKGLEAYYVKSYANEGLYDKLTELGLPRY